jgi:hypothetical protein
MRFAASRLLRAVGRDRDHLGRRLIVGEKVIQREGRSEFGLATLARDKDVHATIPPRAVRADPSVSVGDECLLPREQRER